MPPSNPVAVRAQRRSLCWVPLWNERAPGLGLEHLLLAATVADSTLVAFDDPRGAFRLGYRLEWDASWRILSARLDVATAAFTRSLQLVTDGQGHWRDGEGSPLSDLDGCVDIDIWPTPFTNTFPIRRAPLAVGERRAFVMAWVRAPGLTVQAQPQAYTRIAGDRYRFENLDGSGFEAELTVDDEAIVLEYPGFFRRVEVSA